jgi:hypothetical protein
MYQPETMRRTIAAAGKVLAFAIALRHPSGSRTGG